MSVPEAEKPKTPKRFYSGRQVMEHYIPGYKPCKCDHGWGPPPKDLPDLDKVPRPPWMEDPFKNLPK